MYVEVWQLENDLGDALDCLKNAYNKALELYEESLSTEEKSSVYFDESSSQEVPIYYPVPIEGSGWKEMGALVDELLSLKTRLEKVTEPFKTLFESERERKDYEESMCDGSLY